MHRRTPTTVLLTALATVVPLLTVATAVPVGAAGPTVAVSASSPGGPFVSGIAGSGNYAGLSTVTATNTGTSTSPATRVTVDVPADTQTASFTVGGDQKHVHCRSRATRTGTVWTCSVPPLAGGASLDVATIVGSEDSQTGLPATVTVTVVGPDGTTVPETFRWVLPYAHLTATWSGLPTGPVDWGSAVSATLTVTNDGIWPAPVTTTVDIATADPAQMSGGAWAVVENAQTLCGPATPGPGLVCSAGVPTGDSWTYSVTAYPTAPSGGPLVLTASDSTGDFTVASPDVPVTGTGADLSVAVTNPPTVTAGTTFPRTYTVTNAGSTEATGVTLTDGSSPFLVEGSAGGGGCAYASGYRVGGRITCSFGTVPAHSSVTIVATLLAPITGDVSITYSYGTDGSTTSPVVAALDLSTTTSVTVVTQPAVDVSPPTLTGPTVVGGVLTATWGTWSGTGTIDLWAKLCHSGGVGCSSDIASTYTTGTATTGAPDSTAFTYTIPATDTGSDLVLYVSGTTSAGGWVAVTTAAVGPVTG